VGEFDVPVFANIVVYLFPVSLVIANAFAMGTDWQELLGFLELFLQEEMESADGNGNKHDQKGFKNTFSQIEFGAGGCEKVTEKIKITVKPNREDYQQERR
jgi:hypothetical protein